MSTIPFGGRIAFAHLEQRPPRRISVAAAVALAALLGCASRAGAIDTCAGDCNGDGAVSADETLIGANLVLGTLSLRACPTADASGDGSVNLTEVYRYAYDNTLRASSRTLAGTQHPSFRYALTGHGDFVLTWLEPSGDRRAWFSFPEGRSYLVLQGDADGPVIAEVGMRDRRRTISVHEGRYFIRARGREHLLEGTVTLVAGDVRIVRDRELERIAYARLVRKGEGVLERVHGILFAVRGRSALANSHGMCWGAAIGYALETSSFSVGVRVPYCHSGFAVSRDAGSVDTDVEDLGVEVRLGKPWDVGWGTVEPFVATGGGLMWQRFDTDRVAPDRLSAAVHVDAGAGLRREADSGTFLLLDAAVQTHWFRQAGEDGDIAPSVGIAVSAGLGRWF